MRRPTARRKPRESVPHQFPAPTAGLIANRNLIMADKGPPGAVVMRNFFPTATGCVLRRGLEARATVSGGVQSLFSYVDGAKEELFAATAGKVFRIDVTPVEVMSGKTSGDWSVVQFATAGGVFLIGVNGKDAGFLYDGTSFTAPAITFPAGVALTTADLSFVWAYKNRLWFIQKGSADAWYLPVDQIGGELTLWPMGGVFTLGGQLQWGQAWSLDSGGDGGLSEQCVFVTTEGEVAAYQGLSPDPDQGWSKVGTYRIGRPMGRRAFIRAGGDLLIATTVGFLSLAAASRADSAVLGASAISYPIESLWQSAVRLRGPSGWMCETWPDGQMILVIPPNGEDGSILAINANTGAWCEFTGWVASAVRSFAGRLYLGTEAGVVAQAWAGGKDLDRSYTGQFAPLFSTIGAPTSRKFPKLARVTYLAYEDAGEKVGAMFGYRPEFPSEPGAGATVSESVWGSAIWGEGAWGDTNQKKIFGRWRGVGGSGGAISIGVQMTSDSTVPIDVEIVGIDMMIQTGDAVT